MKDGLSYLMDKMEKASSSSSGMDMAAARGKLVGALKESEAQGYRRALQEQREKDAELSKLHAQAFMHSATSELTRIKLSASRGICWLCHRRKAQPENPKSICATCAQEQGV